MVRRKRVLWVRLSRRMMGMIVLSFGVLGLVLSLQPSPAITVTGGRIGVLGRMLLEMLEFARLGI